MIDPGVDIEFGQALIDMLGPGLAPMLDQLDTVPVAHLGAEAVFVDLAHGQHDMGVRLGLAIRADIPMHIEISDHALIDKLALNKVAGEIDALGLVHLSRNGELDLT